MVQALQTNRGIKVKKERVCTKLSMVHSHKKLINTKGRVGWGGYHVEYMGISGYQM